jgi:iron complex transport system permease protein
VKVKAADPFRIRRRWGLALLALAVIIIGGASLSLGAVDVPADQVAGVLGHQFGLPWFTEPSGQASAVVWGIRMPRLLLGMSVGAALAAAGAALQGMLRNDLADPHLLGIGPGAAIGAAIGAGAGGVQGSIAGGVAAGILTAFVVRRLRRRASIDQTRLILSGVALGAALSAWVGFIVFGSDRSVVPPIEFWLLGGLTGSTWRGLGTTVVFLILGLGGLFVISRTLDLLALGDQEAWHLGVDVELVTTVLLIVVGAVVGATVGAVGVVVFVGLLVPYLMRRLVGPRHRHLLLGAMLGGAAFLAASDLVAKLAIEPIEIPVGLVTSVVGGPLFLWLVSRRRDV